MKIRMRLENKSGVILVTVLMILFVMMILTVSIVSLNVSQVMTTEDEVYRIQAETLAEGVLYLLVAQQQTGRALNHNSSYTLSNGDASYPLTVNSGIDTTAPGGIYGTHPTTITVNF